MEKRVPGGWTAAEQDEIWTRWRKGESFRAIGRHFGTHLHAIRRFVAHRRLPAPAGTAARRRADRG